MVQKARRLCIALQARRGQHRVNHGRLFELPGDANSVVTQAFVVRDQHCVLDYGLSDKQTIERVAVMPWQRADCIRMVDADGQWHSPAIQ
jgi:hypothetical protein